MSPRDRKGQGYRGDGGRGGGVGRGRGRRSHQQEDGYNQGGKERWGKPGEFDEEEDQLPDIEPEPDFGLSGALAAETNTVNGIVMLHNEPAEARPPTARWRLYVFKGNEPQGDPLHIHRESRYIFGRERKIADIPTDHPSCSKQHAVLQFRLTEKEGNDGMMVPASAFDISTKMKARVHVITARGHGPNSLFPHEVAWLELWSVKNANHKIETSKRPAVASKPLWDEIIELEIGKDEKEIVMKMRGKLPSHDAVDEIGSGTYHIENIETGAADKHSVNVPIYASNGKEAGEIDLEIEIEL
ncbi:hypothetical protein Ndes2526B_g03612 [Nannochloris sp. 'desiccata']